MTKPRPEEPPAAAPATPRAEGAQPGAGTPESLREIEERLARLEQENQRLKLLVADLSLRNEALKLVVAKKY